MARVLIVGCGCRGRALAAALGESGHAVRGTTRSQAGLEAIEATGAEATLADPDRLATLVGALEGVSVLCWLMGTASGPPRAVEAVHGPRLRSMLAAIVDTPVRGVVYEAAGTAPAAALRRGAAIVREAAASHRIPAELIEQDPGDRGGWLDGAGRAVGRILAPD